MWWLHVLSAALATAEAGHVLHERRDPSRQVKTAWREVERVQPDAIIPLRIGLKQNNLELGPQRLSAISHPDSEEYGKHMSMDDVHDLFAPSQQSVDSVRNWLLESGVNESIIAHSDNKGWLAANVPASVAEALFQSELYEYESSQTGHIRLGCDEYHVPEHLVDHIDFVMPGVKMSAPLRKRAGPAAHFRSSGPKKMPNKDWLGFPHGFPDWWPGSLPEDVKYCGGNITPPCWRYLYNLPYSPAQGINDSVNTVGLYEQGDYFATSDIDMYFAKYAPYVEPGYSPKVLSVDGGEAPVAASNPGNSGESDIDIDIITSLTYPQSLVVYQVDDALYAPAEVAVDNTFNTFLDAIDGSYCNYTAFGITGDSPGIDPTYPDNRPGGYMGKLQCGVYNLTRVVSASYGEAEQDFPPNYVRRQCNEFMKLGLQGHTILVSAGDYGVGQPSGDPTVSGCLGPDGRVFNPDYPSGCPYITSVGATMILPNQTVNDPESVMQVNLYSPGEAEALKYFSSSGGFSNVFETADYQKAAVDTWNFLYNPGYKTYVANYNATNIGEDGGRYNRAGRGYPDVAANGAYMPTYVNGTLGQYFGTSLASPIWASTVTLINQQRTLIGKGPVGFLNHALYSNPWILNDITNGSNANCKSDGFKAVPGWDPATGLGTPNYPRMLDFFLALP